MNLLRVLFICVLVLVSVVQVTAHWDKDDIEIFELQAALQESEGSGTSFYSVLGLRPGASVADIRKAYRQKSLEWHPDKNPDRPDAHKRFERLGLIHRILRDERRDRYDHFLANGFPRWSGSGYHYARFRPSLLMTLAFLVVASVVAQYFAQQLSYKAHRKRLDNLRRSALAAARGAWFQTPSEIKGKVHAPPASKTVRVPLGGFSGMPPAPKGDNIDWQAEGEKVRAALQSGVDGRIVEATVYADGSIAVRDPETEEWFPLEIEDGPTFADTWPFKLVKRITSKNSEAAASGAADADEQEAEPAAAPAPASAAAPKSRAARRRRAAKSN
ncbi:hypothetical protein MCUN1_000336 [Malassezia cuniculi]|uniref:J domain-containing protein n=1 Tax=Malassezia cuniculi TaxID=948313 RepID=A0AAF0J4U8_9BASI|nr:hypothetical protein MCUN1_000336 [Malassezia cuniculi]